MTLYRVEFRFRYGGSYYSESFTDTRDVENLYQDLAGATDRVRFMGSEMSDDNGETWEPYRVGQTPEERDAANAACSPACFDDCDGSEEEHVPAGIYDPSLPY